MMSKNTVAASVAMAGLTLALACEQGTPIDQQAQPAESENAVLIAMLRERLRSAAGAPAPAINAPETVHSVSTAITERFPVFTEWTCDDGGVVTFQGDYVSNTDASGNGTLSYEGALTPERCTLNTKLGTLETNGDPSFTLRATRSLVQNNPSGVYYATVNGKFTWKAFGRTVRCTLDVEIWSQDGVLQSLKGKACGLPI